MVSFPLIKFLKTKNIKNKLSQRCCSKKLTKFLIITFLRNISQRLLLGITSIKAWSYVTIFFSFSWKLRGIYEMKEMLLSKKSLHSFSLLCTPLHSMLKQMHWNHEWCLLVHYKNVTPKILIFPQTWKELIRNIIIFKSI